MKSVVGIGEILWDMLPDGKQLGGAPTNFAYHVNALGSQGIVISCVGDDELGNEMMEQVKNNALIRDYITVEKTKPTSTVSIEIDAQGQPSYQIHQNVAWDWIPKTPTLMALVPQIHAVCFGSLAQRSTVSRNAIQTFLMATSFKTVRIFDINLRQSFYSKEIIDSSLQLANVFKMNEEELPIVAQLLGFAEDESTALEILTNRYQLHLIAITKGGKGSILYSKGQCSVHAGYPIEVKDTVGAGDAFTAALAVGILKKHKLERINDNANRLAAYVCSQAGAIPPLPNELRKLFD